MHFFGAVIVPPGTTYDDAHKLVADAMAPYSEDVSDDGWWDWWQIGGRWTGALSEYDPREDPANMETCWLCHGSGIRPDASRFGEEWIKATGGCNHCMGKGTALRFSFNPFEGDVAPVTYALNARLPYTVVLPDGEVVGTFEYPEDEAEHQRKVRAALERHRDQWLVVVDYHS